MLMGKVEAEWQNAAYVTKLFDADVPTAIRRYRAFVQKGIADGQQDRLVGGRLVRSAGGWTAVKALRKDNAFQKGDERVLGDSCFVQSVLSQAEDGYERKYRLKAKGLGIEDIADKAEQMIGIDPDLIWL
ncbi:MAG: hypothetical protein P8X55_08780 [Desulfosarcinaceae bacterium]